MAEKLIGIEPQVKKKKRFTISMPQMAGKIGFSLFLLSKEVFIGVSIGEVEIEQVVRKRLVKTQKGTVKVFKYDSLSL